MAKPGTKRVTKQMLKAAQLLADGELTQAAIAAALGVSDATLGKWVRDENVLAEYRRCVRDASVAAVAKAQRVLEKQLDSEAGKGFLAQNAANSILNRSYAAVMGEDKQEVTVRIVGGMPDIGMPARTDDD